MYINLALNILIQVVNAAKRLIDKVNFASGKRGYLDL